MQNRTINISSVYYFLLLLIVALVVWNFFIFLNYSIDITDEGYYVQSVRNFFDYPNALSKFGYFFIPLYKACSNELPCIRQLYWLFSFLLAAFTLFMFLGFSKYQSVYSKFIIAFAGSLTLLLQLSLWLPTPNYNSLTLIATLFFAIGIMFLVNKKIVFSALAVAMAGTISAFVKQTTSISLVFCTVILVFGLLSFSNKEKTIKFIIISLASSLIFICILATLMAGSVFNFIDGLQIGFDWAKIMLGNEWVSPSSLFWKGKFDFSRLSNAQLFLTMACSIFLMISTLLNELAVQNRNRYLNVLGDIANFLIVLIALKVVVAFFFQDLANPTRLFRPIDLFVFSWVPLISSFLVIFFIRLIKKQWNKNDSVVALLLIFLPYAFVLGTGNQYFFGLTSASIFIVCLIAYAAKNIKTVFAIVVFTTLISVFIFPIKGRQIYRQPPINFISNNFDVKPISTGSFKGLLVNQRVAKYHDELNLLAKNSGFKKGTYVIDLTGASAGSVSSINGKSVGAAWILGGYPGSYGLAKKQLEAANKEHINKAWLLLENGPRAIDHRVLSSVELSLEYDFIEVGKVVLPAGYGGRSNRYDIVQTLYKPSIKL